jgi:hypothetical protein
MKIPRPLAACLSVLFLTPAVLLAADKPKKAPAVDPHALSLLKRMSDTLAGAKAFAYRSHNILEVPSANGQFITLFSTGKIALKRPNKLRALLAGDAPHFDFFYDGATVSAFAPGDNVFSTSKAPATIDEMLSGLREETGIRFASAPLLFSNPYAVLTRGLTSGVIVGPSTVDGAACVHLAFRSPGVNWEIWLESNARALPRRLAVTFTDRANFPRTVVELSGWNLQPWLCDSGFVFRKPAGAREIPFVSVLKSADR